MPLNLIKKYPELLDIDCLTETQRNISLKKIFKRDIEDNSNFSFRTKKIYPTKTETIPMETLFTHLTTKNIDDKNANGKSNPKRIFERDRSRRLHWVKYHIEETKKEKMKYFSVEERIGGRDAIRTYIYDVDEKYIIVLEPQRTNCDYYLLTAYYLNQPWGKKAIDKKYKNRMQDVV